MSRKIQNGFFASLLFVLIGPLLLQAQSVPAVDLSALDKSSDVCSDFYQFAWGGWIASHPLPTDRQRYGRFAEVQDRNYAILRGTLEMPGGEGDLRKARDYY